MASGVSTLLLPEGHCLCDHTRQVGDIAGRAQHSEVRAGSIATLTRMVASGMGVTLLPAIAEPIEARPGSGIRARRLEASAPGRTIVVPWRSSDPRGAPYDTLACELRASVVRLVGG